MMMYQFRVMAGNHSFLTGLTHQQFLIRYGLEAPISLLIRAASQLQTLHSNRLNILAPHDIVLGLDWSNLRDTIGLLHTAWNAQVTLMDDVPMATDPEVPSYYRCWLCPRTFNSLANLRRHQTKEHGITHYRNPMVNAVSFSVGGLPQCCHCHARFATWRSFCCHLERNCCEAIPTSGRPVLGLLQPAVLPSSSPQRSLTQQSLMLLTNKDYCMAFLDVTRRKAWTELREMSQTNLDLTSQCLLCGCYTYVLLNYLF